MEILSTLTLYDYIAIFIYFATWISYEIIIESRHLKMKNLTYIILKERILLIRRIRQDKSISTRFATFLHISYSGIYALISILTALVGVLVVETLSFNKYDEGFDIEKPISLLQFKLILAIILTAYCLFTFLRALRIFSINIAIMSSLEHSTNKSRTNQIKQNKQAVKVNIYGFYLYNHGWRSLFFVFSYFSWLLNNTIFMITLFIILAINIKREFFSVIAKTIKKYPRAREMHKGAFKW